MEGYIDVDLQGIAFAGGTATGLYDKCVEAIKTGKMIRVVNSTNNVFNPYVPVVSTGVNSVRMQYGIYELTINSDDTVTFGERKPTTYVVDATGISFGSTGQQTKTGFHNAVRDAANAAKDNGGIVVFKGGKWINGFISPFSAPVSLISPTDSSSAFQIRYNHFTAEVSGADVITITDDIPST